VVVWGAKIYLTLFFIFVGKVFSFMLYIRMMVELKNIYITVVSSYTYKFLWNWKKYIKK